MRTIRMAAPVLAAAVVAVIAGCGSSSGTTGAPNSSSTAATGEEIRVGAIGAYTGSTASNTVGSKDTIMAWAKSVNDAGGINGHPIRLIVEDDANVGATSVTLVKKLVEQDHVVAIVGNATTNSALWASYVQERGIPVIGGNISSTAYLTNPAFFSAGGNQLALFYVLATLAKSHGPSLGEVTCAEVPTCASSPAIIAKIGAAIGVNVTYSGKAAAANPDYTAVCQALKSSGVQSYNLSLVPTVLKRMQPQCVQQGVRVPLITTYTADASFLGDPTFEGMEVTDTAFPFFDESTPATKQFHETMARYAPTVGTSASPFNHYVAQTWMSAKLFEAAVKAAPSGSVTAASIKQGLYALKDETLGGLSAPLNFTSGDKPSLQNCGFSFKIQSGKFVKLNDGKPICAPSEFITTTIAGLGLK